MIMAEWYHIPTVLSLGFIALVLTVSIVASLKVTARRQRVDGVAAHDERVDHAGDVDQHVVGPTVTEGADELRASDT
jgi:hypothetical protein